MILHQRRLTAESLEELIRSSPVEPATIDATQRDALSTRLRAVPTLEHRRLDAWMIERAGRPSEAFHWSPASARRVIGNSALRHCGRDEGSLLDAVREEIAELLVRAVRGYARPGSLAHWLSGVSHPVLGLITADALNWATQTLEIGELITHPWRVAAADLYYDVPGARTTLRGRRDLVIGSDGGRVTLRVRSGSPGKSAGPGLRADLLVDALAHPEGRAPRRLLGVWPDAGLVLAVDGTLEEIRPAGRDVVRAAVAHRRVRLTSAA